MAQRTYRLRIVRGELQFEAEGDKAFVLDMLKRFEGDAETRTPRLPSPTAHATPRKLQPGKGLSPSEFIRHLGFKRHADVVLAFGYYIEVELDKKEFTSADINTLYYEAKMENSNTSQMCINNIRRGFMMEAKAGSAKKSGRKKYTLTQSGEQHVKTRFGGESE